MITNSKLSGTNYYMGVYAQRSLIFKDDSNGRVCVCYPKLIWLLKYVAQ